MDFSPISAAAASLALEFFYGDLVGLSCRVCKEEFLTGNKTDARARGLKQPGGSGSWMG